MSQQPYYLRGNAFNVRMNSAIGWLARHGFSLLGSAEMSVRAAGADRCSVFR